MSMMTLAINNFKASFKSYLSLIISLSFTIMILFNFQNLLWTDILTGLGKYNSVNINAIIQIMIIVIFCFMIFFIWYSTNVFLTSRKKAIGIYVFMGLSNQKIAMLYLIEIGLIGLVALTIGIVGGIILSQLFTMIVFAVSSIKMATNFVFSAKAIVISVIIFLLIYGIFIFKGYIDIMFSSVISMMNAKRQNEIVLQKKRLLFLKALLGIGVLGSGFYLSIQYYGIYVLSTALISVILVIIGIYLIFGGFIPLIFQQLANNKHFLYQNNRTLWINAIIFRIRKNYRTYAIVSVLMLCAVTALGTGFAMKNKYENIARFESVYTYQIMSSQNGLYDEFSQLINEENEVVYGSEAEVLLVDDHALLSYSQLEKIAVDTGLELALACPLDDEYIRLGRLLVMSFINDNAMESQTILDQQLYRLAKTTVPYLGYMQENMSFLVVNDDVYAYYRPQAQRLYFYNYRISDATNFLASVDMLQQHPSCEGLVKIDPNNLQIEWLKLTYSIAIFMFMVFVVASGSIIFMKTYNDAFEEKERYDILYKIGIDQKQIIKALNNELAMTFILPLFTMSIASYFSIKALSNVMFIDLTMVNVVSVLIIYVFFYLCYRLTVVVYKRNVNLK